MYCIAAYGVGTKRTAKALKTLRRYLFWVQRSVFEGELSDAQVDGLMREMRAIMKSEDSLVIYSVPEQRWLTRRQLGREKGDTGNFL